MCWRPGSEPSTIASTPGADSATVMCLAVSNPPDSEGAGMSRKGRHLFTSESVTEGHPDKIADQISDAILDAILTQDPVSRVACETLVTTGLSVVAGEITTSAYVDFQEVVRSTMNEIGHNRGKYCFDGGTRAVLSSFHRQSPDNAMRVDTYGGAAPHGGGAFSGKDPTKVDRSACYMARYIAKNVVAAGIAERALVQLAYAIGVADPVSVMVHTEGTGRIPEEKITKLAREHFKLTPRGIMEELDLRRPIYKKTAAFGHFGRTEPEFTWERTDKAASLKSAAGL